MSLEDAINKLTAAVEANTKALGGKAPAKETAGSSKPSKPAASSKKKDGPDLDEVVDKFGTYLNEGSAAHKKKAKKIVAAILSKFDQARVSKLEPDDFVEALDLLAQYQEGEDPLDVFEDEEDDDDGMM